MSHGTGVGGKSALRGSVPSPNPTRRRGRAGCAPFDAGTGMWLRRTHPPSAPRAFFGYFLCTGKESDSLAAGERKPCLFESKTKAKALDSGFRRNDELELQRHGPCF